jgi:foldase protein PrsA
MKSVKRSILALGAFFVLALALSACGGGVPGNAVVDMAGNSISTQAFKHWMFVAAKGSSAQSPGAPVIVPTDPPDFKGCIAQVRAQIPTLKSRSDSQLKSDCSQLFDSLKGQVLDFLIRAYWYQATAAKLGIKITDAQVQKAFQTAKKAQFPTDTAFQQFLTQSGQTMQDILFRVRVNQIYQKLLAKRQTTVTNKQIQDYFFAHPSQFGTPESRDLRIVRTNKLSEANAAKTALDHGQSWTAVAKKYSVDSATKNKGGLLKGVTRGQDEAALDNAAFAAVKGKIVGPVHGQFGYYVIQVVNIKQATHQSIAAATPLIKQILSGQQQTNAQTAVDAQAKKQWLSKTKCRSGYAIADCAGYKPPKTATQAPGATPSTAAPAPSTTTTSSSTSSK